MAHRSNKSFSQFFPVVAIALVVLFSVLMLTTFYSQTSLPIPINSIVVSSSALSGSSLPGVQVDLRINGSTIKTAYTPATFSGLTPGVVYQIVVYWLPDYYFRHFSDGQLNRYDTVTLNGSKYSTVNALYEFIPPSESAALDVIAQFPNGTEIGTSDTVNGSYFHTPGMWMGIVPPGQNQAYTGSFTGGSVLPFILVNHDTYVIQLANGYGNVVFSHWKDNGGKNPTRQVTMNGNASYVAVFVQT
ncbi:MAG: hypothetical protein ACHQ1H_04300 [Nitrososphaerales archaeon]